MARPEKYFARTSDSKRVYPLAMAGGETLKLEIDWNQILGEKATSITNSCFESNNSSLGISGQLAADGITSVLVAGTNSGGGLLENCVTLASGETLSRSWFIRVTDPHANLASDYQS